jgi:hypothetical protein
MTILLETVTAEQKKAARKAAEKRYQHNLWTPDRAGWTGGKCPVNEYRAIVAELAAANFLGVDWKEMCLYSPNKADYTTADLGVWEVKAGNKFTKKDKAKGAQYILWVMPWTTDEVFECGYETCGKGTHKKLNGQVEIRGWTDIDADLEACKSLKGFYMPTKLRSAVPLVKEDAA